MLNWSCSKTHYLLKGYISSHILICTRYLPTHDNDSLVKRENKEGRVGDDKERKILSLPQAERTMRRPEFRASQMEFQSQHAFLPGVGSLDREWVKTTKCPH